jgi:hypothetical protein
MVESLEGDNIYLEHTTAKVVRGKQAALVPECDIRLVDYQTSYKSHKTAKAQGSILKEDDMVQNVRIEDLVMEAAVLGEEKKID